MGFALLIFYQGRTPHTGRSGYIHPHIDIGCIPFDHIAGIFNLHILIAALMPTHDKQLVGNKRRGQAIIVTSRK